MTLAIIGSGFGRTGTMSLKRALEELGFGPCHHMQEVLAHPEQVAHWQAIAAGRPVKWDEVFAGYRSQVNWPGFAGKLSKTGLLHAMPAGGIDADGIVRLNSILPPGAPAREGAPLFLLRNRRRARRDSTPKMTYTNLP